MIIKAIIIIWAQKTRINLGGWHPLFMKPPPLPLHTTRVHLVCSHATLPAQSRTPTSYATTPHSHHTSTPTTSFWVLLECNNIVALDSAFASSWRMRWKWFYCGAVNSDFRRHLTLLSPRRLYISLRAFVVPSFNLTSQVMHTSPTPHKRKFVCGACVGTIQVGVSLAAPLDSLIRWWQAV